jgi:23S rRNA (guanosine2251-2'-O)-methyltransferase
MQPTVAILNNIRSLYNVGSIFRTSDALGIHKLYLCGITGTPENPRLAKTALAGLNSVDWEYKKSALRTVKDLKKKGYTIVAIEITPESQPIKPIAHGPLAIVMGHERQGVDKRILAEANYVMHIPMHGVGKSMNVSVAYGIATYTLLSLAESPTPTHTDR